MSHRSLRFPADTSLRVKYKDELHWARLVNVSTVGARLAQLPPMPKDASVTLCYLDCRIPARVVWAAGRHIGVRFEAPLSPTNVNALRGSGSANVGAWGTSLAGPFRELS